MTGQCPLKGTPEDTAPQAKAHMGGNQVMGFSSSSTTAGAGTSERNTVVAGRDMVLPGAA